MITSILVHFIDETVHEEAIKFVDPCIALASIGIIVLSSLPLGKRLAMILLLGSPDQTDVQKLSRDIVLKFPGDVLALHEFHVWSLMHSQVVATLHVTYKDIDVILPKKICFFLGTQLLSIVWAKKYCSKKVVVDFHNIEAICLVLD